MFSRVALVEVNAFSFFASVTLIAFRIAWRLDFASKAADSVFAHGSVRAGMICQTLVYVAASDIFVRNGLESVVAFALVVDQLVVAV